MLVRGRNDDLISPHVAAGASTEPLWLLDQGRISPKVLDGSSPKADEGQAGPSGEALLCMRCGLRVTSTREQISVQGAHRHTFANPYGFLHRVGCFATAPGCLALPEESTEFSWFSGYSWRIEICSRCCHLLGWLFCSAADRFHGLILDHLVEEKKSGPAPQS